MAAGISVISEQEIPMKKGVNFFLFTSKQVYSYGKLLYGKKIQKKNMKFRRSGTLNYVVMR